MDSNTINALKRLERVGSETSRATEKLYDACIIVANAALDSIPCHEITEQSMADGYYYTGLPRGYTLHFAGCDRDVEYHLSWRKDPDNPCVDVNLNSREDEHEELGIRRNAALHFARDVATGWLDELAEWLEARTQKSEAAAAKLESSKF